MSILPQIELTRERVRLELLARTAQEARQRRSRLRLSAIGLAVIAGLAVVAMAIVLALGHDHALEKAPAPAE